MDGRQLPGASTEGEAKVLLAAMSARLAAPAHTVLGIAPSATAAEARAAFLELTRRFHPTRFARMSPELVRQANEVFLAIKKAYEQFTVRAAAFAAGVESIRGTAAPGTGPVRAHDPAARGTPVTGVPVPPGAAAATSAAGRQGPAAPPRAATPPVGSPALRVRTPTPAPPQAATPPVGSPALRVRPPTPAPPLTRAPHEPPPAAATASSSGAAGPGAAGPHSLVRRPGAPDHRQAFNAAMALVERERWDDAALAFQRLAVAAERDPWPRAYVHYCRGRGALAAGRTAEARAELERALSITPDLRPARLALDGLAQRARRPTGQT